MNHRSATPVWLRAATIFFLFAALALWTLMLRAHDTSRDSLMLASTSSFLSLVLLLGWRDTEFRIDASGEGLFRERRPLGSSRERRFRLTDLESFGVAGTINWVSLAANLRGSENLVLTQAIPRTPQGKALLQRLIAEARALGKVVHIGDEQAQWFEIPAPPQASPS